MKKTKHFQARMSQRGINQEMVELVLELGEQVGDKIILKRKTLEAHIEEVDRNAKIARRKDEWGLLTDIRRRRKTALKVLDKGGLIVVAEEGHLLTTYHFGNGYRH